MPLIEQYNNEIYHYGVKGMKWGVRNKRVSEYSVQKSAKKLANYEAQRESAAKKLARDVNVASATGSLGNRQMRGIIRKSEHQLQIATKRAEKQLNKMTKKLAGTPYADIKISKHTLNGRTYISTLIGSTGYSPYDGTERYRVTAGTWSK